MNRHRDTQARTRTHRHSYISRHTGRDTVIYIYSLTHNMCTDTDAQMLTCTDLQTHTQMYTCRDTHNHRYTHAHTQLRLYTGTQRCSHPAILVHRHTCSLS